jgi:hypothetical protein
VRGTNSSGSEGDMRSQAKDAAKLVLARKLEFLENAFIETIQSIMQTRASERNLRCE